MVNSSISNGISSGMTDRSIVAATKTRGIKDGWFSETEAMYPGQKFSLALEEFSEQKSVLYSRRSQFQDILVFRSAQYGNVLVLDGVIQVAQRDEFAYHEMMTHVPLFAHHCPKNVLIVGGGDGGILREVCRHDCVEKVTMVEIDPEVIAVSKKFFADSFGPAFEDPRVEIINADASAFLQSGDHKNRYDCILSDTSDPVGPAEALFHPSFYESMYNCLKEGGIVCAQSECMWIHLDFIADIVACCTDIFDFCEYATTLVPTFPCGQIGFVLATKKTDHPAMSCQIPQRIASAKFMVAMRYYNPDVHRAAFVLPEFVKQRLKPLQPHHFEDDTDDYECFLKGCVLS